MGKRVAVADTVDNIGNLELAGDFYRSAASGIDRARLAEQYGFAVSTMACEEAEGCYAVSQIGLSTLLSLCHLRDNK